VCKFHDYVFPNQMQFCIGSTSANLLEHYWSDHWMLF
jgi:hypothetical protein